MGGNGETGSEREESRMAGDGYWIVYVNEGQQGK